MSIAVYGIPWISSAVPLMAGHCSKRAGGRLRHANGNRVPRYCREGMEVFSTADNLRDAFPARRQRAPQPNLGNDPMQLKIVAESSATPVIRNFTHKHPTIYDLDTVWWTLRFVSRRCYRSIGFRSVANCGVGVFS